MPLLNLDSASLPKWTASSIAATGATTLVSAPGAGYAIAVQEVRVVGMTTTTGQVQGAFLDGTTTARRLWHEGLSLGAVFLDRSMESAPLVLDTNTALQYACTVSAASTPSLFVEVCFQVVRTR